MDRYKNFVHKNKNEIICRVRENDNPENRKFKNYLEIQLTYDNFAEFISNCKKGMYKNCELHLIIYDEATELSVNDVSLRYSLIRKLNDLNIYKLDLNLSDEILPFYNCSMKHIGWKHADKTTLKMTIDRNPIEEKDLKLSSAQGKLLLPEEKLIWVDDSTLHQ